MTQMTTALCTMALASAVIGASGVLCPPQAFANTTPIISDITYECTVKIAGDPDCPMGNNGPNTPGACDCEIDGTVTFFYSDGAAPKVYTSKCITLSASAIGQNYTNGAGPGASCGAYSGNSKYCNQSPNANGGTCLTGN